MIYPTQMITYIIISAVLVIGLAAFFRAISAAAVGYEDEFGFHAGSDPQHPMSLAIGGRALAKEVSPLVAVKVRRRRLFKRPARDSVSQSSSAPFPIG
jgi:hypothetical protein